jgi:hypothetical protein
VTSDDPRIVRSVVLTRDRQILVNGEPIPWYTADEELTVKVDRRYGVQTIYIPLLVLGSVTAEGRGLPQEGES